MPLGIGDDALAAYAFHLEIDGISKAWFKKVSGLSSEITVIENHEMSKGGKGAVLTYKKTPGKVKWGDLVCEQGLTQESLDLWSWHEKVKENIDEARKNGAIVMYGYDGNEEFRFNFLNGWPSKINISGSDAAQPGDTIQILSMTIVHEGLKRK